MHSLVHIYPKWYVQTGKFPNEMENADNNIALKPGKDKAKPSSYK